MEERLKQLCAKCDRMKVKRNQWEAHWQELKDYINPDASEINRVNIGGERLTNKLYDGTALWALEQLASGLQSFLTSPTERWFNIVVQGYDEHEDPEVMDWLEVVSDIIYNVYGDSRTNVNSTLHQTYMDLGSFGTAINYQEYSHPEQHIIMRPYPLADVHLEENSMEVVDTLDRVIRWDTRQIEQEFPNHGNAKILQDKTGDRVWEVHHFVFPRTDRDPMKLTKTNKKFASFWFCKEAEIIFKEDGFDDFPYNAPRWIKRTGEVYGRSPGMTCLPDIKMVNTMEKFGIKALQKIVDPPLLAPSDGFIAPIRTTPGSIIYYESGMADNQMLRPLETKGRIDAQEEKLEQKRGHISRCFYADWITRMKKKERQTTTEILDDRDEMLQLMAPILGRLMAEQLGPMIKRTFRLLKQMGRIPPAPASLAGMKLDIDYISPAAKAQQAVKGSTMLRYSQELVPIAQIKPDIMDAIDTDRFAQELAYVQNVSRKILRSPEDIKAIRDTRNQQQQMQSLANVAEPASNAIKNIADAQSKGGIPGGGE